MTLLELHKSILTCESNKKHSEVEHYLRVIVFVLKLKLFCKILHKYETKTYVTGCPLFLL